MLNPRIKLRHLQAFLAVAKHNSFARAAEQLSVSPPAMSKTMRELEQEVSAQLFVRGPQGVTLTASGLALLRYAGPALNSLQQGLETLAGPEASAARVRLGALSTVEGGVLPLAIARLHQQAPDIGVQVETGASAYLLSQLGLGEFDLVVGA